VVGARRARVVAATLAAAAVGLTVVACSSDNDASTDTTAVQRGAAAASQQGCTTCHGDKGQGGVGPAWQGLAGSTVELGDGTDVVADSDYIRRSIVDPQADRVADYTAQMPQFDLSDDEVDALVAYIESLGMTVAGN
jgi:cytochrome c oxidase subunit 2